MRPVRTVAIATFVLLGMLDTGARASHTNWYGDCGFDLVEETGPRQVGNPDHWTRVVHAWIVATGAGGVPMADAQVDVACELRVNDGTRGTVLAASGQGAVVAARPFSTGFAHSDIVVLCSHVTIDGETQTSCGTAVGFTPCPQPAQDAANLLLDELGADEVTGIDEFPCDSYRSG